ncbi:MAG: hypothetical protein RIT45_1030 [Pseudomonadota bacterium]
MRGLVIEASAAARDQGQKRRALRAQLSTLIAADPRNAREAAELLRQGGPDVDRRTLIEALAGADSTAAKLEMAGIMDDAMLDGELRADVATGTTFMPRPGETLIASLQHNADVAGESRLGTSALWALAAQAELQTRHDAALAARLSADVLARTQKVLGPDTVHLEKIGEASPPGPVVFADGVDPDSLPDGPAPVDPLAHRPGKMATFGQAMAFLDALGNLGGEQVFKLIRPRTRHPDHQIRMTATMALRSVPTVAARMLIMDLMARDPDGWVRRSAVMAAAYHPAAIMIDPAHRALKEDVHANVRLAAAYNLAFWAYESPTLIEAVREAAQREPKPFVARAMRDLEPMLFRDTEGDAVTMEPMLHGGQHIPSIPEGVLAVERQVEKTAKTAEGALVGKSIHGSAAPAVEEAP